MTDWEDFGTFILCERFRSYIAYFLCLAAQASLLAPRHEVGDAVPEWYRVKVLQGDTACWDIVSGHSSQSAGRWVELNHTVEGKKKPPWPYSTSELHRPSDRCLSRTIVPTFADEGVACWDQCHSSIFLLKLDIFLKLKAWKNRENLLKQHPYIYISCCPYSILDEVL
jgi:hypothetical protein